MQYATAAKRFTAACLVHATEEPRLRPGACHHQCGKGHAKTFGNGPIGAAIGDMLRLPVYETSGMSSQGVKYNLPSSLRSSSASLGPWENTTRTCSTNVQVQVQGQVLSADAHNAPRVRIACLYRAVRLQKYDADLPYRILALLTSSHHSFLSIKHFFPSISTSFHQHHDT